MNIAKTVVTLCLLSVTCSTASNGIIDTNNVTATNNINDIIDINGIIDININDIINDLLSIGNDMGSVSEFLPQDSMNNVFASLGASSSLFGKSSIAVAANNSADVFREAFNLLWKFYLPVPRNLSTAAPNYNMSETCSEQVTYMHSLAANSTHPMPPWLSQMVDSWAKPADGILNGKYNFFGVMEQCLKVKEKEVGTFDGRYCNIILGFSPALVPSYSTCMPVGCQPHEMQESLIRQLPPSVFGNVSISVDCLDTMFPSHWGSWELGGSAVIGLFLLVVVVATVADLYDPEKIPEVLAAFSASSNAKKILAVRSGGGEIGCFHAIRVFSICWVLLGHQLSMSIGAVTNIMSFFEGTAKNAGPMQVIWSGMRAVDTFFFLGGLLLTKSMLRKDFCIRKRQLKQEKSNDLSNVAVIKDTKESGTGNLDLEEPDNITSKESVKGKEIESDTRNEPVQEDSDKNISEEKVNKSEPEEEHTILRKELRLQGLVTTVTTFLPRYAYYLFHRIARIWPGMFLTIMFFAGPSSLFAQGPRQKAYTETFLDACRKDWWQDLTMFTNMFMRKQQEEHEARASCLGQTWYIAVDFQIYLIFPFLILPIKLLRPCFKTLYLCLLILASCMLAGAVVVVRDLPGYYNFASPDQAAVQEYMSYWYLMPWTRATPYCVGALCGHWLGQFEKSKKSGQELLQGFYKKHPAVARMYPLALGWLGATALAFTVVFDLSAYNFYSSSAVLSRTAAFFYAAFEILAWCIAVAWVVMNCAMGLAGPVNFFLSHPMWQPLSRLSFGVYLVSVPIQYLIAASFQQNIYISYNLLLLLWCGVVTISFIGAFVLSLLAEAPVINLLKLIK